MQIRTEVVEGALSSNFFFIKIHCSEERHEV